MMAMRLMFAANILVAGWVGIMSLFFPKTAIATVFTNGFMYSEAIRLVGALWGEIFLLSLIGLFYPEKMSLILVFQLIYKSIWLIFAATPAILEGTPYPKRMAFFFLIWVLVLPFVIPWRSLFS